MRKLTLQIVEDRLKKAKSPLTLISKRFVSSRHDLKLRCSDCNKVVVSNSSKLNSSNGNCPNCNLKCPDEKKFRRQLFESNSTLVLQSEYRTSETHVKMCCSLCERTWITTPKYLKLAGFRCTYCFTRGANYSLPALQCIRQIEKKSRLRFQSQADGKEYIVPDTPYRVDGINHRYGIILEFDGDSYHGNPRVFASNDLCHPFRDDITAGELLEQTKRKKRRLTYLGYTVINIWERDWRRNPDAVLVKVLKRINSVKHR